MQEFRKVPLMKDLIARLKRIDWTVFNRYVILTLLVISPVVFMLMGIGILLDILGALQK